VLQALEGLASEPAPPWVAERGKRRLAGAGAGERHADSVRFPGTGTGTGTGTRALVANQLPPHPTNCKKLAIPPSKSRT